MMSNDFNNSSNYNLYGLSASFLESLGISGPLHNKVFVANVSIKFLSNPKNKKFKKYFGFVRCELSTPGFVKSSVDVLKSHQYLSSSSKLSHGYYNRINQIIWNLRKI